MGIHKSEPDIYIGFSPALRLQCKMINVSEYCQRRHQASFALQDVRSVYRTFFLIKRGRQCAPHPTGFYHNHHLPPPIALGPAPPTPPPPPPQQQVVSVFLARWAYWLERGGGKNQTIRRRESLVLNNPLPTYSLLSTVLNKYWQSNRVYFFYIMYTLHDKMYALLQGLTCFSATQTTWCRWLIAYIEQKKFLACGPEFSVEFSAPPEFSGGVEKYLSTGWARISDLQIMNQVFYHCTIVCKTQ